MRIAGEQVILRDEPRESDNQDHFRWRNLQEWDYYDEPWTLPREPVSWEEWERQRQKREKTPRKPSLRNQNWQIDTVEGRHIGWISCYYMREQTEVPVIGITLPEEDTWGQGYGTEAVRLLLEYLFEEVGLEEVRTATWTGNGRMMRVAQKRGFTEIGRRPHEARLTVRGEPLVMVDFALTRTDWLAQEGEE
jgi:RimJ/RimL family protein N-acetyltransferase